MFIYTSKTFLYIALLLMCGFWLHRTHTDTRICSTISSIIWWWLCAVYSIYTNIYFPRIPYSAHKAIDAVFWMVAFACASQPNSQKNGYAAMWMSSPSFQFDRWMTGKWNINIRIKMLLGTLVEKQIYNANANQYIYIFGWNTNMHITTQTYIYIIHIYINASKYVCCGIE